MHTGAREILKLVHIEILCQNKYSLTEKSAHFCNFQFDHVLEHTYLYIQIHAWRMYSFSMKMNDSISFLCSAPLLLHTFVVVCSYSNASAIMTFSFFIHSKNFSFPPWTTTTTTTFLRRQKCSSSFWLKVTIDGWWSRVPVTWAEDTNSTLGTSPRTSWMFER